MTLINFEEMISQVMDQKIDYKVDISDYSYEKLLILLNKIRNTESCKLTGRNLTVFNGLKKNRIIANKHRIHSLYFRWDEKIGLDINYLPYHIDDPSSYHGALGAACRFFKASKLKDCVLDLTALNSKYNNIWS